MSGVDWFDRFVADGPGYDAQPMSVAEMQALLLKAGIGGGLPLGHAQDLSGLAEMLMSDPQLLAMAAAALDGPHRRQAIEGTDEHAVVAHTEVLMAAPLVVDRLVCGARRIVLHDMDWPLLMWPFLAQAERVYGLALEPVKGGTGTVIVQQASRSGIDPFGAVQPVPLAVLERLSAKAAKTYVPATEASRVAGAGAGLTDND